MYLGAVVCINTLLRRHYLASDKHVKYSAKVARHASTRNNTAKTSAAELNQVMDSPVHDHALSLPA